MDIATTSPRGRVRRPLAPVGNRLSSTPSGKAPSLIAKIMESGSRARRSVGRPSPSSDKSTSADELSFLNHSNDRDSTSERDDTATSLPLSLFGDVGTGRARTSVASTGSGSGGDHTADLGALMDLLSAKNGKGGAGAGAGTPVDADTDGDVTMSPVTPRSNGGNSSADDSTQPLDEGQQQAQPRVRRAEDRQTCSPSDFAQLLRGMDGAESHTPPPRSMKHAKTPRSILRRGTPGTGRSVVFGSPKCAEFKKLEPPVAMTPLTSQETRQWFTMAVSSGEKTNVDSSDDDDDEDDQTAHNSAILAMWDDEDGDGASATSHSRRKSSASGSRRQSGTSGNDADDDNTPAANSKPGKRARSSSGRARRTSRSSRSAASADLEDVSMLLDFDASSPDKASDNEDGSKSSEAEAASSSALTRAAQAVRGADSDGSDGEEAQPTPAAVRRSPRLSASAKRQRLSESPAATTTSEAAINRRRSPRLAARHNRNGVRLPPPPTTTPPPPTPSTQGDPEPAALEEQVPSPAASEAKNAGTAVDLAKFAPLPSPAPVARRRGRRRASVCPTDLPSRQPVRRNSRARARRASVSRLTSAPMPVLPAASSAPHQPASVPESEDQHSVQSPGDHTADMGAVAALLGPRHGRQGDEGTVSTAMSSPRGLDDSGDFDDAGSADDTADLGAVAHLLQRGRESLESLPSELRFGRRSSVASFGSAGDDATVDVGAVAALFAASPAREEPEEQASRPVTRSRSRASATPSSDRGSVSGPSRFGASPASMATASTAGDNTVNSVAMAALFAQAAPRGGATPAASVATTEAADEDATVGSATFGALMRMTASPAITAADAQQAATPASVATRDDNTAASGAIANLLAEAAVSGRASVARTPATTAKSVGTAPATGASVASADMSMVTASTSSPGTRARSVAPPASASTRGSRLGGFDLSLREDDTVNVKSLRDLVAEAGQPTPGQASTVTGGDATAELGTLGDLLRETAEEKESHQLNDTPASASTHGRRADADKSELTNDDMEFTDDYAGLLRRRASMMSAPSAGTPSFARTSGDKSTEADNAGEDDGDASMELTGDYAALLEAGTPASTRSSKSSAAASRVSSAAGSMASSRSRKSVASASSAASAASVASAATSASAVSSASMDEGEVVQELRSRQREELLLQTLGVTPKQRPPTPRQLAKLSARSQRVLGLSAREEASEPVSGSVGASPAPSEASTGTGDRSGRGRMMLNFSDVSDVSPAAPARASVGASTSRGAHSTTSRASSRSAMQSGARLSIGGASAAGFVSEPSYDHVYQRRRSSVTSGATASPVNFSVSPLSKGANTGTRASTVMSQPSSTGRPSTGVSPASVSAGDGAGAGPELSAPAAVPPTPNISQLARSASNAHGVAHDSNFADIDMSGVSGVSQQSAAMDDALNFFAADASTTDDADAVAALTPAGGDTSRRSAAAVAVYEDVDMSAASPVAPKPATPAASTPAAPTPEPQPEPEPEPVVVDSIEAMFKAAGLDPATVDQVQDDEALMGVATESLLLPAERDMDDPAAATAAGITQVTIVAPQMSDVEWTADYLESTALPHLRERVAYLKRKAAKHRPAAFDAVAAAATRGDTDKLQEVRNMWEASKLTAEQELLVWRAKGKRGVQATLEKHCDDLAELRKRVEELKISLAEKVAEKRAEVQRLQEEAKAQAELKRLQQDVDEQGAVVSQLEARKAELEAGNAALEAERDAAVKEADEYQATIDKARETARAAGLAVATGAGAGAGAGAAQADAGSEAELDVDSLAKAAVAEADRKLALQQQRVKELADMFRGQRMLSGWSIWQKSGEAAMTLQAVHGGFQHRVNVFITAAATAEGDADGNTEMDGSAADEGKPSFSACFETMGKETGSQPHELAPRMGPAVVGESVVQRLMQAQGCAVLFNTVCDQESLRAALQESSLRLSRVEMACQELEALAVPYDLSVTLPPADTDAASDGGAVVAQVHVTFFRAVAPRAKFRVTFGIRGGYPFANVTTDALWMVGQPNLTKVQAIATKVASGFNYLTRVCAAIRDALKARQL